MPRNAAEPLVSGAQECRVRRSLQTQPGIASLVLLASDAPVIGPGAACRRSLPPNLFLADWPARPWKSPLPQFGTRKCHETT